MNQTMLVGKLIYKVWLSNRMVCIVSCQTPVGNGYEDIEVEVSVNDIELAKQLDKKLELNSLVGFKGYINHHGLIEVVQATNLNTNIK